MPENAKPSGDKRPDLAAIVKATAAKSSPPNVTEAVVTLAIRGNLSQALQQQLAAAYPAQSASIDIEALFKRTDLTSLSTHKSHLMY